MAIAIDLVRGLANLAGYAVKIFLLTLAAVAGGYGILLALIAWYLAANDSWIRGTGAVCLSLLASTALALFIAVQVTISKTVARAIKQLSIGSTIFEGLFDLLLGVNEDNPAGDLALSQSLHGLSRDELKQRLIEAGEQYLRHERIEAAVPRLALWIFRKMQKTVVWAIVQIVLLQCKALSDGPTIDLIVVRDSLAGVIDEKVGAFITKQAVRTILLLAFAATVIVIAAAGGIRWIPVEAVFG